MIFTNELTALRDRLVKAEAERDTWQSTGMQEKYLEAYCGVEALERQLDQLLARAVPAAAQADERERTMTELRITYDGRQYHHGSHRYDRLEDAAAYARLRRLQPPAASPTGQSVEPPTEFQQRLMGTLDITYAQGVYRFGPYRYDHLADAIAYARRHRIDKPAR